ncbi:SRPBCC family protein [Saccharothrix yanglingensis]|uniref:Polyketide cyclase n=1 Tax=Saccharothrix yanglingensis TaxID=659496 RepID=A0ABU0WV67_9PSEU|nr:SRPBCC family protein [Saccharothrix yanglingensis]MDQ2583749.1 polyketide cyclase [Saccharothrix yanglingensis]
MEARTRAPGRAPAAVVWERYAEPARWPGWAPQITGVEASARRIAPGVTGRVRGPLGVRVAFTVTEVDPTARTWAWDARIGPVRLRLRHGVEPDGATWLVVRGPASVVVAYLPIARLALRSLTRR